MPKKEVTMDHIIDILEDFAEELAETNEIVEAQDGVTDNLQDQIDDLNNAVNDLVDAVSDLESTLVDLLDNLRNV